MLTQEAIATLRNEIVQRTIEQRPALDHLLESVKGFDARIKTMRPREMTSTAFIGTEVGTNVLRFDPFLVFLVRVVDSSGRELMRQVLSAEMSTSQLSREQFESNGQPRTPVGRVMEDLGFSELSDLSPMIPADEDESRPTGWVRVFRIISEWATLYASVMDGRADYDRLYVVDNLLRCKLLKGDSFVQLWKQVQEQIENVEAESGRNIRIAGIMPRTQVLNRISLALAIQGTFKRPEPCYARVPPEIESDSYKYGEWARTPADELGEGEKAKFAAGKMHIAKFGSSTLDDLSVVDIPWFQSDTEQVAETMGYLLRDCRAGFPEPWVPMCLQRAREFSRLQDLDAAFLNDQVYSAVLDLAGPTNVEAIDLFDFQRPRN